MKPPEPLVITIECTLIELYIGCKKDLEYKRIVLAKDGQSTMNKFERKTIEVKPGYSESTEIRFPEEGNCAPGLKNSDLVVKIKQIPHKKFQRKDNDLIYKAKISLVDALCSKPINITTIDNRTLYIPIDEVINPNT